MFRAFPIRAAVLAGAALVALATLASPAAAAPAAPVSAADAHAAILKYASRMPAPSSPQFAAGSSTQALTMGGKAGGPSTNLVITCLASSQVATASAPGYYNTLGTAWTSCPAAVSMVSAQATLFFWSPDLNQWFETSVGTLAYDLPYTTPGKQLTSIASSSCENRAYAVVGFHQARLNNAYATATTSSSAGPFSFCAF